MLGFKVGERIGPYEITQYIGQGGMATIYKARQHTLDRYVAIKVIHPALKDDQAFLTRLNREAAIVAQLNHPNIVPVYDFGDCDGIPYLVMRYVDGKTLKTLLQESRLDTARILSIARSIADALGYAHEHGVLHRDVKPSNVLLDSEGNVYLTDFGLARMVQSNETTLSRDMLIGSPLYISPEQARGEAVDNRSDIYSFGVVLYEMFTGRVPFSGDTPYATIMAHINDPLPPPRSVNPSIPRAVEVVLQKALSKDRQDRYASANELVTALGNAISGPQEDEEDRDAIPIIAHPFQVLSGIEQESASVPEMSVQPRQKHSRPPSSSKRWVIPIAGTLVLCLIAASIFAVVFEGSPLEFVSSFISFPTETSPNVVSSPRGETTLVSPQNTPAVDVVPATATLGAGPTAVSTSIASDGFRGKLVYSLARGSLPEQHSIWVVDVGVTGPRKIIDVAVWPSISPDGKQVAYFRMRESGIYVSNSDGTHPKRVIGYDDTCCVQWSPDGKRLTFFRGSLKKGGSIYTANVDGSDIVELTPGFSPSFSPDGRRIAYTNCQPSSSVCGLYVYDIKSKTSTMITQDNGANPQWSPRGDRIVYQADDGKGHINVFVVNSNGTGGKQLTAGKSNDGQPEFTRDGNFIVWRSDMNGAGWSIFAMRSDGSAPRLLVKDVPVSIYWGRESLSMGP